MSKHKKPDLSLLKRLYDRGKNSVEISKILKISPVTVRYHYKNLGLSAQSVNEAARKYPVKHNYFKKIDSQEKAYILGLMFADGCNYRKKEQCRVILELIDKDIIETINRLIQPKKPVRLINHTKGKDSYRMDICCKDISDDLNSLGMVPRKSLNLSFPTINKELERHFIRGFFDGDGGISLSNRRLRISFVGGLSFLQVLQIKLNDTLDIPKNKIIKNCVSEAFSFSFSAKKDVNSLHDWLYKDSVLFIKRKKNKFNEWKLQNNY